MKTIFISSTFKDMQFERDILNTKVLPGINEIAKNYGDSVALCDLRWGINTNGMNIENSNIKILNSCLHEIDRCRPYMIVFLGERYGWVPGEKFIKYAIDNHPQFAIDKYDISVTALEIEYGAFFDPKLFTNTLFYFRRFNDSVPEEYAETNPTVSNKLEALKQRIKDTPGSHVYTYDVIWNDTAHNLDGLEQLADRIIHDLSELMIQDWKKYAALPEFERENNLHWEYAKKNSESFYEHTNQIEKCSFLLSQNVPFFVLHSQAGSGKTTFLSKLSVKRKDDGIHVLPIFCGLTKASSNPVEITKHIIRYLHQLTGIHDENLTSDQTKDFVYWKNYLSETIHHCKTTIGKTEILIDGIDILKTNNITELPFFIDTLPENISIVFSCSLRQPLPRNCPVFCPIFPLDYFDTKHAMEKQLKNSGKELDEAVLQQIFQKNGSGYPLYLQMILGRLSIMQRGDFEKIAQNGGTIDAIIDHQIELIQNSSSSLEALCNELVQMAGERINPEMSNYIIKYICASYSGISEHTLQKIFRKKNLNWSPLDFRILVQFLEIFLFMRENGYYDLTHPYMRASFPVSCDIYQDLIDELDTKESLSENEAAEYTYYCLCSRNYKAYLHIILDYETEWTTIAKTTFHILQYKFHYEMSQYALKDFMTKWITDILHELEDTKNLDIFKNFFTCEYKLACLTNCYFWRVMAKVIFEDWETVDAVWDSIDKKAPKPSTPQNYMDLFTQSLKTWDSINSAKIPMPRKEYFIPKEFRKEEQLIDDHSFYFFNVPRKGDNSLYFMRDDLILLEFSLSSAGDHCSYDITYNSETGHLIVQEADFDHYDRETMVSTYEFSEPLSDMPQYFRTTEWKKGAYNLPLRFSIS